tara:strand:- start:158 stop:376 length:219 start_codon:yes stop_codon:yes gene_type:complete
MAKSFAPMFNFGDYETQGNAERYATREEAERSAQDRFMVWMTPSGWFVQETDDPVNYRCLASDEKRVMINRD